MKNQYHDWYGHTMSSDVSVPKRRVLFVRRSLASTSTTGTLHLLFFVSSSTIASSRSFFFLLLGCLFFDKILCFVLKQKMGCFLFFRFLVSRPWIWSLCCVYSNGCFLITWVFLLVFLAFLDSLFVSAFCTWNMNHEYPKFRSWSCAIV